MGPDQIHTNTMQSFTPTLTADMLSHHNLVDPPLPTTLIKMEDLQCSSRPSPTPSSSATPGPSSEGKPVKKRKSWGQVLPEPKTNLPPRKRAKTEDEKEQRRIERVKRNRLAAHNSRERKRQEVELLQAEKDNLERELKEARESMARMAAQLQAYRSGRTPEDNIPEHNIPDQPHLDLSITTSIEEADPMPQSDTICPRQTSFPSPISMDDMDTPRDDSCLPETPGFNESLVPESDATRYPAVSVGFGTALSKPASHTTVNGFPYSLESPSLYDDKAHDVYFDFSQFPEQHHNNTSTALDPSDDFFNPSSFITHDSLASLPFGLADPNDAHLFDLQTDSGATAFVSDESCLAAE